jgi:hypothetical protein
MKAVETEKVYLDAASILTIKDLGEDEVWIEKWGTYVRVRGMTAGERTEYSLMMADGGIPKDAQARMVEMCAMDANGNRMFLPEHVAQLSQKSADALEPLTARIMELSGMSSGEVAEKN